MDLDDSITFCQNDLHSTSFSIFEDMRKRGELCDLKIQVRNSTLTAHRVVLTAVVPYFRSLFATDSSEIETSDTVMEKLDFTALESLINFAYTSKVDISLENVQSLLVASEFMQLSKVKGACVEYLSKRIFMGNVTEVWTLANILNCAELTESCSTYIQQNFEDFSKSEEFLNLPYSCLMDTVSKDYLHISGEETVFEAVMNWVKALPSERKVFLLELLIEVRLIYLPISYLLERVALDELIIRSPVCRDLIESVNNFHLFPDEKSFLINLKTQRRVVNNFPKGIYAICNCGSTGRALYACDVTKETWKKLVYKDSQKSSTLYCAAAATSEDIYLFYVTTLEKINLHTLHWQALELTHDSIECVAAVPYNNSIYFFGSRYRYSSHRVRCFDTENTKWLKEHKINSWRCFPAVAALEEVIYVTGGFSHNDRNGAVSLSTAEKYNPTLGESQEVASMLTARGAHGCATMNGKIYVCGGCTNASIFSDCSEVYDPMTDQWIYFNSMKIRNSYFSLISHNGKLYSIGGMNPLRRSEFEVYNPETDEWKYGFSVPEEFRNAVSVSVECN